jgi:hypothetical protein
MGVVDSATLTGGIQELVWLDLSALAPCKLALSQLKSLLTNLPFTP